jgi:hypothetical protein
MLVIAYSLYIQVGFDYESNQVQVFCRSSENDIDWDVVKHEGTSFSLGMRQSCMKQIVSFVT